MAEDGNFQTIHNKREGHNHKQQGNDHSIAAASSMASMNQ
jgi:hypothetical protein